MKIPVPSEKSPSFFLVQNTENVTLSLYDRNVSDEIENHLTVYPEFELISYLIPSPSRTYLVKMDGDAMVDANIPAGAHLIVERSDSPANNSIVIARVGTHFLVRRYIHNSSGVRLMPANSKYQPMPIASETDFSIWGVVTRIIIDMNES